jgi:hypothetical protein
MPDTARAADRAIADAAREGDFPQPLSTRTGPPRSWQMSHVCAICDPLVVGDFINLRVVVECVE